MVPVQRHPLAAPAPASDGVRERAGDDLILHAVDAVRGGDGGELALLGRGDGRGLGRVLHGLLLGDCLEPVQRDARRAAVLLECGPIATASRSYSRVGVRSSASRVARCSRLVEVELLDQLANLASSGVWREARRPSGRPVRLAVGERPGEHSDGERMRKRRVALGAVGPARSRRSRGSRPARRPRSCGTGRGLLDFEPEDQRRGRVARLVGGQRPMVVELGGTPEHLEVRCCHTSSRRCGGSSERRASSRACLDAWRSAASTRRSSACDASWARRLTRGGARARPRRDRSQ